MDAAIIEKLKDEGFDVTLKRWFMTVPIFIDEGSGKARALDGDEVPVMQQRKVVIVRPRSIPKLFTGSRQPPSFARGPTDAYMPFFVLVELAALEYCKADVLSGGRLRLGVATGWNPVEYEALGVPFAERGARIEEQIELLRALFTQPAVTFAGRFHSIPDAGINPLPIQRPIPIWMGGGLDSPITGKPASDTVLRRIARLADGWMPLFQPNDRGRELLAGRARQRVGADVAAA